MLLAEGTYVSLNSSEATMDDTATNIAALELQNRGGQNGHLTNICELGPSREPCWCHRGGAPGVRHLLLNNAQGKLGTRTTKPQPGCLWEP